MNGVLKELPGKKIRKAISGKGSCAQAEVWRNERNYCVHGRARIWCGWVLGDENGRNGRLSRKCVQELDYEELWNSCQEVGTF